MLAKLVGRKAHIGLLVLRLVLAVIFVIHGSQKLFGWFEGDGIGAAISMFTDLGVWWPSFMAWVVALIEFLAGVFLLVGFLSRESALALIFVMAGAIYYVHGANGFLVSDGGYEYNLLIIAACLNIVLGGGGEAALDQLIFPQSRWQFIKDPSSVKLEPPEYDA